MTAAPRPVPPSVNGWNADYLDAQYARFREDPDSIPPDLREFFQGFDLALSHPSAPATDDCDGLADALRFQSAVDDLVEAYRKVGHLAARLDPFDRLPETPQALTLAHWGLTEEDLDRPVNIGHLRLQPGAVLRDIIELLSRTYCRHIGFQIAHVSDLEEREWLLERFERDAGAIPLTSGEKVHVLQQLISAEMFEKFIGRRYPGEKRFSLEGGESLIVLLDRAIEAAAETGVEEIVMGMSHRGRLNVLNNILGKTYEQIFTEFEDNWEEDFADGGGDVKYHRGYSGVRHLRNGRDVQLALASNPSHLESVNGVVLGRCRAKQRLRGDSDRHRVIPLLVHGDAAFIGQGIVAESLNLSQLQGYTTGGAIHVVVNNLIGFTTGPEDARSTHYCTDIALMIEAPVFHVNGEDPEAVVAAAQMAVEYRQKFKKDVVIDLYCFRRYGHNEQDEPSFTQPILASLIKKEPSVLDTYAAQLFDEGILNDDDMKTISRRLDESLEQAQASARVTPHDPTIDPGSNRWAGFEHRYSFEPVNTAVSRENLALVCQALGRVPEGFNLNPKLKRLLRDRANLLETGDISYADAESLAFGTLLLDGVAVRLTGQDSRRGTFSHRHAVLRDYKTAEPYSPLNNIRPVSRLPDDAGKPGPDGQITQARFCVYDSPLSEAAVLSFEYGYSLADPNMLVMWEAQFGDFVNGAQVIIDQYLASAELKWDRWSGLTLLLPHGYEGAGPEHSSARLERFLELCGNDNMQVVHPSTAAQAFHMFRRQLRSGFRKPLIVMTPKSMLRVPTSRIEELMEGRFHEVLDDPRFAPAHDGDPRAQDGGMGGIKRIALCTGKIYHELAARAEEAGATDIAIIRIEQLYPFHAERVKEILARYPKAKRIAWVQEEPRNMGAWHFISEALRERCGVTDLHFIGRPRSATPAVGSKSHHKTEQEAILTQAIGPAPESKGKSRDKTPAQPTTPARDANGTTASEKGKKTTPKARASA